jgi:hypothetical protein
MPPPVADERQALRDYLAQQQYSYHALAFGLTDEQARAMPGRRHHSREVSTANDVRSARPLGGLGADGLADDLWHDARRRSGRLRRPRVAVMEAPDLGPNRSPLLSVG